MSEEHRHRGIDELMSPTLSSDIPTQDEAPASEPEPIAKETVMSKLQGSVQIPEEFKFAENITFYTMLRNIFRGKNILVTGPSRS
jgi:hypothetical protein